MFSAGRTEVIPAVSATTWPTEHPGAAGGARLGPVSAVAGTRRPSGSAARRSAVAAGFSCAALMWTSTVPAGHLRLITVMGAVLRTGMSLTRAPAEYGQVKVGETGASAR